MTSPADRDPAGTRERDDEGAIDHRERKSTGQRGPHDPDQGPYRSAPERPLDAGEARELQNEWAEDRTEWAHRRTVMAKERTFAGWVRTGLSAIAVGFGAAQLLAELEPQWLVMAASFALIALGVGALLFGYWRYRDTLRRLEAAGVSGAGQWLVAGMTLLLVLVAAAGAALIFLN